MRARPQSLLCQTSRAPWTIVTRSVLERAVTTPFPSRLTDSINCVWRNYDQATASVRVEEMEKVSVNTRSRADAYIKYNTARSGTVMALPEGDTCVK